MTVYRLTVSYDGSDFRGFARQPEQGVRTVQGALERALALLLRQPIVTTGAGRTDAGVHATGQVVSFVFDGPIPDRLDSRLTKMCGPDLSVLDCAPAADDFDARFSALWRQYRYRLLNRPAPDPLRRHVVWHHALPAEFDLSKMEGNLLAAVGEHDFTSFCRVPAGAHARRRVISVAVERPPEGEIHIVIRGTAFCHQMVRSLVGCAVAGKSVADALAARNRAAAGQMAPAHGLCLEAVGYP